MEDQEAQQVKVRIPGLMMFWGDSILKIKLTNYRTEEEKENDRYFGFIIYLMSSFLKGRDTTHT